jgi:nucleotide-binding universal stress UspA family protein
MPCPGEIDEGDGRLQIRSVTGGDQLYRALEMDKLERIRAGDAGGDHGATGGVGRARRLNGAERASYCLMIYRGGLAHGGMPMYERLLVAVDHSEVSDRVIAAARDIALLSKGKVWVLHLREREWDRVGLTPTESDQEARAAVTQGVEALIQAGVDAQGEVREALHGHAAREIVEDAKKHDAGVIVMGSRGRGDLAGLVLGSTAHKVIHLTDRPVLVVR